MLGEYRSATPARLVVLNLACVPLFGGWFNDALKLPNWDLYSFQVLESWASLLSLRQSSGVCTFFEVLVFVSKGLVPRSGFAQLVGWAWGYYYVYVPEPEENAQESYYLWLGVVSADYEGYLVLPLEVCLRIAVTDHELVVGLSSGSLLKAFSGL